MDALAGEVQRQKTKRGLENPFVYVNLRDWLPAGITAPSKGDPAREQEAVGGMLEWSLWHLAFDAYAIGAACVEQLSFGAALAHKRPERVASRRRGVLCEGRLEGEPG